MMPIRDVNGGIQAKLQYCVAVRGNSENLQNAYNYIKLLLSPHIQHAINRQVLSVLNSANDYFYQKAARGDTHLAMAQTNLPAQSNRIMLPTAPLWTSISS